MKPVERPADPPQRAGEAPASKPTIPPGTCANKRSARENLASEGAAAPKRATFSRAPVLLKKEMRPGEFGQRREAKPHERTENSAGRRLTSEGRKHAPGRIRIPNLLIRSQVLYPVELRALDMSDVVRAESGRPRGAACPGEDSNLHVRKRTLAPQASASASSATWAGDARGGSRTPTGVKSHRILNPARLPVPPPEPAPLDLRVRGVTPHEPVLLARPGRVRPTGFEPVTSCSGGKRSIQAELRAQTRNAPPEEATRRASNLTGLGRNVHNSPSTLLLEEVSVRTGTDQVQFMAPDPVYHEPVPFDVRLPVALPNAP